MRSKETKPKEIQFMGLEKTKLRVAVIGISDRKRNKQDIRSQAAKKMLQWTQRRIEISYKDCM